MKNRLTDLNDHLFAQLERLSDEGLVGDALAGEIKRTEAIVQMSDRIVDNARLQLDGVKLLAAHPDLAKRMPASHALNAGQEVAPEARKK